MSSSSNNSPSSPRCSASVFIATSKDGYIADSNNSVDWLNDLQQTNPLPDGDDGGFNDFMSSTDAVVMGRTTYETVCQFVQNGIDWPYTKPVYVLTRNFDNVKVPSKLQGKVKAITGDLETVMDALQTEVSAQDVYVDGGATIRSFLDAGLVKRAIITVVPVTLGNGVALFTKEQEDMLQEVSRKEMVNGFIQITYSIQ